MYHGTCRRISDRRWQGLPFYPAALHGRRASDHAIPNVLIDYYRPPQFLFALFILVLCCLDAFNTTQLLSLGARELSPLVEVLLVRDTQLFVLGLFPETYLDFLLSAAADAS